MTSGEYAYDLLRQLQKRFRHPDPGYRAYLYNFFGELFGDPSVVVTQEAHAAFIEQMDTDCDYYANKGLTGLRSIYEDENFNTSYTVLQKSFATIGITMTFQEKNGDGYPKGIDFTLPNGVVKSISNSPFEGAYLCARSGVEYNYARRMMPYYTFANDEIKDLSTINTNIAGYGTTWTFDEATGELEIAGSGSFAGGNLLNELGIAGSISTIILGSGVNRLSVDSLDLTKTALTIVSFRGTKEPMTIDSGFIGSGTLAAGSTPYYTYTIYTDNEDLRNAPFSDNKKYAIVFKPLSEWAG